MPTRATVFFLGLLPTIAASQNEPLSAIEWLSNSIETPQSSDESSVESGLEMIVVRPLDHPVLDGLGLAAPEDAGLPVGLWSASDASTLSPMLADLPPPELAANQSLLRDMLAVSADPPQGSIDGEQFFLARLDTLLSHGAFDDARLLMERAGSDRPETFRRWFDLALLTGDEDRACQRMRALPDITPTYPARIFCLARSGDWAAAAVTLETARALDVVTPSERELLTRFLDQFAGGIALPPPEQPTPLDYMLYEAIGEPLRSRTLPLPFAHANLRRHIGWKQQLAAAERLARAGAIKADGLFDVYGQRAPAASGEPWDRIAAWQSLNSSIEAGDPARISETLTHFWQEMQKARLLPSAAAWLAPRLDAQSVSGEARDVADRAMLLSGRWNGTQSERESGLPTRFIRSERAEGSSIAGLAEAARAGLTHAQPPDSAAGLLAENKIGEALIEAITMLEEGAAGSLDAFRDGLAIMRLVGLEPRARAAAIEILLAEPKV